MKNIYVGLVTFLILSTTSFANEKRIKCSVMALDQESVVKGSASEAGGIIVSRSEALDLSKPFQVPLYIKLPLEIERYGETASLGVRAEVNSCSNPGRCRIRATFYLDANYDTGVAFGRDRFFSGYIEGMDSISYSGPVILNDSISIDPMSAVLNQVNVDCSIR